MCGPARAALYTGQYPARIGFEKNIRTEADGLSSSIPSLPRWLHDAGYRTALFGKWHLGSARDFTPNAHDFDEFIGHHQWTVSYYNHKTEQGDPGLYENDRIIERDGYLTDLLSDEAVDFIGRNRDKPFFLTLAYNAALPPYQPPGLPESKWDDGWDVNTATRDDYVRMVERMDEGIGKVLDTLDALNLDEAVGLCSNILFKVDASRVLAGIQRSTSRPAHWRRRVEVCHRDALGRQSRQ